MNPMRNVALERPEVQVKLNELLNETLVVEHSPIADIEDRIKRRQQDQGAVALLYGETYDTLGNTIDSLKYYLFIGRLAAVIASQYGCSVQPNILVADIAACRNFAEDMHEHLMAVGQDRCAFAKLVSSLYGMNLNVILMSEFLHTTSFQDRLEKVSQLCLGNNELEKWLEQTVPESKVETERAKGFQYALEEITTIIEMDIKVGPPREIFYDEPTRMLSQLLGYDPLLPVYLTPTYPLGVQFDYFLMNLEVEKYGVTAYKAGSKGMQNHRIIIGKTSPRDAAKLLQESFLPTNPQLPNPVLDIALIAEMARQGLDGRVAPIDLPQRFYTGDMSEAQLREHAIRSVQAFIIEPLAASLP